MLHAGLAATHVLNTIRKIDKPERGLEDGFSVGQRFVEVLHRSNDRAQLHSLHRQREVSFGQLLVVMPRAAKESNLEFGQDRGRLASESPANAVGHIAGT